MNKFDRGIAIATLMHEHTKKMMGIRIVWRGLDNLAIENLGLDQVAATVDLQSKRQGIGQA